MTTTLVHELPIALQEHEVRAVFDGRKTQVRQLAQFKSLRRGFNINSPGLSPEDRGPRGLVLSSPDALGIWNQRTHPLLCPYGVVGDRLWVRETWHHESGQAMVRYKATGDDLHELKQWKSSSSMPRWACRLVIEILGVHVERLTHISDEDAVAEGFDDCKRLYADEPLSEQLPHLRYIAAFRKMHKLTAIANPWLWVIDFKKLS